MNPNNTSFLKYKNNPIVKGTFILTFAGILTRIIGFFFRIFLSRCIGAEGIGIYQLIFPIQAICYSLCTSGYELSISKLVASAHAKNQKSSMQILKTGLMMSLSVSVIIAMFVYFNNEFISTRILAEERCKNLIRWMSITIPLASIHSCICGYYLGIKKASVPAWSQLIEQCTRVLSIWIIIQICYEKGIAITAETAVIGSFIGEIFSVLYTVYCISNADKQMKQTVIPLPKTNYFKKIFKLSLPLTLNRLMLSIIQSIQSILIPFCLISYGLTSSEALSLYGICLGLVLPLIMFPGALVNSISLMLLPTIAEAEYSKDSSHISNTSDHTLKFCCLFGIYCAGIFVIFGNPIGVLLFNNATSGTYICILGFLCPFLYITATLASILNGLGYTHITFIHSVVTTLIQLFCTIILIPGIGIVGYLMGLLVSSIISSVSHYISAKKYVKFHIDAWNTFLIPTLTFVIFHLGINFINQFINCHSPIQEFMKMGLESCIITVIYLLVCHRCNYSKSSAKLHHIISEP